MRRGTYLEIALWCAIAQLACSSVTADGRGAGGAAPTGGAPAQAAGAGGEAAAGAGESSNSGAGNNNGGARPNGGAAGEGEGGRPEAGGPTGGGDAGVGGSAGMHGSGAQGGTAGMPGGAGAGNGSFVSDFTSAMDGWACGFSDYPPGAETFYELKCQQAPLPTELGSGGGVLMQGNNHSDDLFMYLTRKVQGLSPSTKYVLSAQVDIGTNAPGDCGGIGGAPGPSVFVKIGASATKPAATVDNQGHLRLNLDQGAQSNSGADMKVVGNLSNTFHCPNDTFQAKALVLSGFSVQSAADGSVWIIVGTDSGFEGITTLYYDKIAVTLTPSN